MNKLNVKTVVLTGSEQKVKMVGRNCDIRNDGTDIVYAGCSSGLAAGADGVVSIPAGQAVKLLDIDGTVYLLGTGSVLLSGNDYSELVFKTAATPSGEGGTVDDVARNDINTHTSNSEIHLTVEKATKAAAAVISNPNLLINPDFRINQRGKSGTITDAGYFVDCWQLESGSVTVNADGTLTLNGTIKQVFEKAVGSDTVAMSSAGTAFYDDSNRSFTLTASGDTISWAKLEAGSITTPFVSPNPATELTKCQRYLYVLPYGSWRAFGVTATVNTAYAFLHIPTTMRAVPTVLTADGEIPVLRVSYNGNHADTSITSINASPNCISLTLSGEFSVGGNLPIVVHYQSDLKLPLVVSAEI